MRIDFAICRCVRTEYGKRIRKLYESHQISEKRGNMTQLEARTDGRYIQHPHNCSKRQSGFRDKDGE